MRALILRWRLLDQYATCTTKTRNAAWKIFGISIACGSPKREQKTTCNRPASDAEHSFRAGIPGATSGFQALDCRTCSYRAVLGRQFEGYRLHPRRISRLKNWWDSSWSAAMKSFGMGRVSILCDIDIAHD